MRAIAWLEGTVNPVAATAKPSHLVVILAPEPSAGLGGLLSSLPPHLDAAVVVAPERDGHAFQALGSVHQLTEISGPTALSRGVFLAPAQPLQVTDGSIVPRPGEGPAVGAFVESAARAYGERLVVILLQGSGPRPVEAAIAVGENDGTLIVEKPRSGRKPLPPALPPTAIDIFSEPENIGDVLAELVREDAVVEGEDAKQVGAILERIRDRHGIDFTSYKLATIRRRLDRRMLAVGADRLSDYAQHLTAHPEEYQRLISSFLIKVTDFFRDPAVFDHMRDRLIPELVEKARSSAGREIRVWSAGCATGEEAYSIALAFAEVLGHELKEFTVRVFATDIDGEAVGFARQGVYPAAALRKVPRELLERWFVPREGEFEVSKAIRGMVVFGQHDLAERAPFPRVDMIVCRNVLIYFTEELQMRTLQLFAFALKDGGFLVLGQAESTHPLPHQFAQEDAHLKVFRRQGERILIPPPRRTKDRGAAATARQLLGGSAFGAPDRAQARKAASALERADRLLVNLPVGIVVVDKRYDVLQINAAARRMLGIRTTGVGEDFVHLASALPPAQLRAALDQALRGESTTATLEVVTEVGRRHLALAAHPGYVASVEGGDTAVVVISDVTEPVLARLELERTHREQGSEVEQLRERVQQLTEANRQLVEANEDLAIANMDLRTTNDELLVSNEEVQAATEEVETLNEELQATNEELETLNEELQATVEELNTTNDDLQQRSEELEQVARGLDMADAHGKPFAPGQSPWARAARGEGFDADVTIGPRAERRRVRVTIDPRT